MASRRTYKAYAAFKSACALFDKNAPEREPEPLEVPLLLQPQENQSILLKYECNECHLSGTVFFVESIKDCKIDLGRSSKKNQRKYRVQEDETWNAIFKCERCPSYGFVKTECKNGFPILPYGISGGPLIG